MDAPINDPETISKFLIQPADPSALAILIFMNKLEPTVRQVLGQWIIIILDIFLAPIDPTLLQPCRY